MNIKQIKETLNKIPNGSFFRITYSSDINLSASAKKQGYRAIKVTSKTVRKGVNYSKMASVIKREALRVEPKKEYKNPYETIIKNCLYRHVEKDKEYLQFANSQKGQNTNSYYIVYDPIGNVVKLSSEEFKVLGLTIPSYWNKSGEKPEVQKIAIENIMTINCKSLNK